MMMGNTIVATRAHRGWIRVVIFVSLYLMLLLSLTGCALVLYLYSVGRVDGTMTPSLILGLVAAFLSVPFVVLHALLSWQYRKASGLNIPRNAMHIACLYLPRIMIVMWLATSVAGLVVVSKQATCAAGTTNDHLWQAGISCQVHRGAVIVDILAFVAACALLFSFQVCDRPYDVSLLGLYAPRRPTRGGSIFSESSWESETLKHEIFYLCRHPDAGPGNGELYWSPNDSSLFEAPVRPPSIRYPGPARLRPQLHVNTHTNSVRPSIATAPLERSPKVSPVDSSERSNSLQSGVSPLSRNPSMTSSLQPGTEAALTRPRVPDIPEVPEIPAKIKHSRQKSSVSSRRFLPKEWTLSQPLSEDPQIRALSSPTLRPESDSEFSSRDDSQTSIASMSVSTIPSSPPAAASTSSKDENTLPVVDSPGIRRRSMTAPGDPPLVLPPVPLLVRKSRTSIIVPPNQSIHHPHHPNYTPPPPRPTTTPTHQVANHGQPKRADSSKLQRETRPILHQQQQSVRHRPRSPHQPFEQQFHLPRHTQSQYRRQHYQHVVHPQPRHPPSRPAQPRRFHSSDNRFDPARALPPIPRSDDTAIVYPSTRRPRSSTYGGISNAGGSLTEIGNHKNAARTSLHLVSGGVSLEADQEMVDTGMYRGAERTSMHGL